FRIPGTQERINCANYFISKFREIDNNFTYLFHNFSVNSIECQNVLFKLNQNYSNIIILGAHYDSRAKATKDPDPLERTNPVPGANDGASGSAVLIELAKALYQRRKNITCQIWFLFFDAEDQGRDNDYGIDGWDWCEGSTVFVNDIDNYYNSLTENFESMILFDMVGGENLQFIDELYSTSSLLDELFIIGRSLGYKQQFPSNPASASIIDDHRAFLNIGIPSVDLIINFWDNPMWPFHHTTQDDILHISSGSLEVTGKTVEQFIYNNYFKSSNASYQFNFPWYVDINFPERETTVILLIIIGIASIVILIVRYIKYEASSAKIKLEILNNKNSKKNMKIF
ncbi:MAG: M28 family peptidase, partial [Promethearchaeota archaeon]